MRQDHRVQSRQQQATGPDQSLAKWLFCHPLHLARADECLRAMGFAGGVADCPMLDETHVDHILRACPGAAVLLEQQHGDQVCIFACRRDS